jgi:hypothetical protein
MHYNILVNVCHPRATDAEVGLFEMSFSYQNSHTLNADLLRPEDVGSTRSYSDQH